VDFLKRMLSWYLVVLKALLSVYSILFTEIQCFWCLQILQILYHDYFLHLIRNVGKFSWVNCFPLFLTNLCSLCRAKYGIDDMCRDQWNWASKNPYGYGESEEWIFFQIHLTLIIYLYLYKISYLLGSFESYTPLQIQFYLEFFKLFLAILRWR